MCKTTLIFGKTNKSLSQLSITIFLILITIMPVHDINAKYGAQ